MYVQENYGGGHGEGVESSRLFIMKLGVAKILY
jgi:hypothetical protein